MDPLGAPIGQRNTVPSDGFDQGEHGAGVGVSGGHSRVTGSNTQSGMAGAAASATGHGHGHSHSGQTGQSGQSGFNAGLGGEHASGGIPKGTPIADKFLGGQGQGQGQGHGHGHGQDTVSGAYEGGGTRDALTGSSHAQSTGAGVGPLGENLHQGSTARESALSGTAGGAAAASGLGAAGQGSQYGTGVGATGGSGGHYNTSSGNTGRDSELGGGTKGSSVGYGGLGAGTGAAGAGIYEAQKAGSRGTHGDSGISSGMSGEKDINASTRTGTHGTGGLSGAGVGAGAGAGAGALGAGALAAGHGGSHGTSDRTGATGTTATTGKSGSGRGNITSDGGSDNVTRGDPLSNAKDIDSGTRHGLVFQESTGKYVHRHELEGGDRK